MKKALIRETHEVFHFKNGEKVPGVHSRISGNVSGISDNVSGIWGDVSGIWGDVSGISGDVTGIRGDASGIRGDLNVCELTAAEREKLIKINDLVESIK